VGTKSRNIQVELALAKGYGRQLLRGLREAILEADLPWNLWIDPQRHLHECLASNRFDGLFFIHPSEQTLQLIDEQKLRAVQISPQPQPVGCKTPVVSNDEAAIGAMAARGLLELGFENFGCLHAEYREGSKRERAFVETVQAAGYQSHVLMNSTAAELKAARRRGLKLPVGVFCLSDSGAWTMSQACHSAGLDVPDEVSIIGCDNDRLLCCHCNPPLSTVALATLEIAREAVALMREMFEGKRRNGVRRSVKPQGVIYRRSTRYIASDLEVSKALAIIEQQFAQPIQVADVAREVGVSVRTLHHRFKQAGNPSIQETLTRIRIQRAKEMLVDSEMSASDIASRTGFSSAEYFFTQFRRKSGMTPTAFRQNVRNGEQLT